MNPENGVVELFNLNVLLKWTAFDSDMIGTPCSATIYGLPTVFILLNPIQEVDITNPYPMTEISNTTTTSNSFTIGNFLFLFLFLFINFYFFVYLVVFLFRRLYAGHPASGAIFIFIFISQFLFLFNIFIKYFKNIDSLSTNTTYFWRIALYNGVEWASSSVFNFTTRIHDCTSVPCISGTCDETTLKCDCDFGWSGDDCSIAPKKNGFFSFSFFIYIQSYLQFFFFFSVLLLWDFCFCFCFSLFFF